MVLQNNSKAFSGLVGLQARLTIKDTKKEGGGEEASNGEGQDGSGVEGGGGAERNKNPISPVSKRVPQVRDDCLQAPHQTRLSGFITSPRPAVSAIGANLLR